MLHHPGPHFSRRKISKLILLRPQKHTGNVSLQSIAGFQPQACRTQGTHRWMVQDLSSSHSNPFLSRPSQPYRFLSLHLCFLQPIPCPPRNLAWDDFRLESNMQRVSFSSGFSQDSVFPSRNDKIVLSVDLGLESLES